MRYQDEESEKGLFTFYREQAEEEESMNTVKKKKKSKSKRLRKSVENKIVECVQSPESNEKARAEESHDEKRGRFLKNTIGKQKVLFSSEVESTLPLRLKTQPNSRLKKQLDIANFLIQKKLQDHDQGHLHNPKIVFKGLERREMQFHKYIEQSNNKINDLHLKIKDSEIFKRSRDQEEVHITKIEPVKLKEGQKVKRSCKQEEKSFLQKLKFLQRKSRSNLISNRESAREKDSGRSDLHDENKKYFHQLISNFHKQSDTENNSAYKILKNSLKFPHLIGSDKIRMKTDHGSPQSSQKIIAPLRSFSSHKKHIMKVKLSNQKYSQLYKLNIVNELRESQSELQGRTLNFIDMSKQYGQQEGIESEQRRRKKRMVKSRLGVEL